jgi:hypothetical protein
MDARSSANMNRRFSDAFSQNGGTWRQTAEPPPPPFVFDPKPYSFPDPATIPSRKWLQGRHYMRGVVSGTIGAPGRMKSTTSLTDVIGMTVGRDLLTGEPLEAGPLRGAYLNGEETQEELDRRVAAIMQRYTIKPEDCGDRLTVLSTRDKPLRFAVPGTKGAAIANLDVVDAVRQWCIAKQVDVLVVDPLVSFHQVRENDSGDMDLLYKECFGRIAGKEERAVDLVIHARKPAAGEVNTTINDLRGSSAQEGALRIARVLNFMTTAEADQLGIDEEQRRLHIRIEGGKGGPAPIAKANWIKIDVISLPNGDDVAVASRWKPPDHFQDITTTDMQLAAQLAQNGEYRADCRSPQWFGYALALQLGIKVTCGPDNKTLGSKTDVAKVKCLINTWIKNKVLAVDERTDIDHKKRKYVVPGRDPPTAPTVQEDQSANPLR